MAESKTVAWLDRKFYPDFQSNWDDLMLRARVLEALRPGDCMLDIGAGAGIVEHMNFKGFARKVVGIDLDERVLENPWLDESYVGDATSTPFADNTFDIIICDNVMEHIAEPAAFVSEVRRILKPGGIFMGKTPNKFHYMPLIARFTPTSFHRFYNKLRGRETEDTFPTLYKLNSRGDVERHFGGAGFRIESFELIEGRPEYLRISPITYVFGILYERLVNAIGLLRYFSILLIVSVRLTEPDQS